MSVNEKMTAIADAIRDKTGGTEALTLDGMASAVHEVFNAGKRSEHDAFWDKYQQNGNRKNYYCAFAGVGWTEETFKPKHKMVPESAYMMFGQGCTAIINKDDLSEEIIDFSRSTNMQYVFYTNNTVETLGTIDVSNAHIIMGLFGASSKLKSIDHLIFSEKSGSSNSNNLFQNCNSLTHVIFSGIIACNISLQWSPLLDRESLLSLIDCLKNFSATGGTHEVILGATNVDKLTDDELNIIEQKGWRYS